jgi:hypothetical protein
MQDHAIVAVARTIRRCTPLRRTAARDAGASHERSTFAGALTAPFSSRRASFSSSSLDLLCPPFHREATTAASPSQVQIVSTERARLRDTHSAQRSTSSSASLSMTNQFPRRRSESCRARAGERRWILGERIPLLSLATQGKDRSRPSSRQARVANAAPLCRARRTSLSSWTCPIVRRAALAHNTLAVSGDVPFGRVEPASPAGATSSSTSSGPHRRSSGGSRPADFTHACVKIDRLDHCIKTEAGRGLAFRVQTLFATGRPYSSPVQITCRITSDRQRWFDADRMSSFPQTAKPYLT